MAPACFGADLCGGRQLDAGLHSRRKEARSQRWLVLEAMCSSAVTSASVVERSAEEQNGGEREGAAMAIGHLFLMKLCSE
jgi:hypothetical protein